MSSLDLSFIDDIALDDSEVSPKKTQAPNINSTLDLSFIDDIATDSEEAQPEREEGTIESTVIGIGSGLTAAGEGLEQFGREGTIEFKREQLKRLKKSGRLTPEMLTIIENDLIKDQKELASFNDEVLERREFFKSTPVGSSTSGKVGEFIGEALPALAVPGALQKNLGKQVMAGIAGGGVIGGAQFVDEGKTRASNAATGAAIGGVLPVPIKAVGATVGAAKDYLLPFLGVKTVGIIKEMGGEEMLRSTAKRIDAAKRLGLDFLTPAEATGNTLLAKRQGNLGTSEVGFKLLNKAGLKRVQQERKTITDLLEGLSADGSNANAAIQARAKKILKVEKYTLSRAARPFYKKAYTQEMPEEVMSELMGDPVISMAYKNAAANPIYQRELGNAPLNSIKTLDIVKRSVLDDMIQSAQRSGNANEARIITSAKNDLLRVADSVSPDYAQARKIFSAGSPAVEKLEKGIVGKLANMDPKSLKSVSKTLFDPAETDPRVLNTLRDKFVNGKGKDTWNRIVRNEFERRIEQSARGQTGTTIFKQVLEKDRDFKMFMSATKHLPKTRQALVDMRRVFKDLIDPTQVRGAAKLAANSTNVERNSAQFAVNAMRDIVGGKKDKALVEIITNPQWHKELKRALVKESGKTNFSKIADLVGRATAAQADEINQ